LFLIHSLLLYPHHLLIKDKKEYGLKIFGPIQTKEEKNKINGYESCMSIR